MNEIIKSSLFKLKFKNIPNPELDLRVLLNHCSKSKKNIFISNFKNEDINLKKFNSCLNRRLKEEPIAKILNKKNFWKYEFYVNKHVLDPRPESELIIEESINCIKNKNQRIKILDVGSGTGCLSICLSQEFKNSKIIGIDISKKALEVTKKNILLHKCQDKIEIKQTEISSIDDKFDLIVSNPPYLSLSEYQNSENNIKNFEPKIAFLGGNDGLKFYKIFSKKLPKIMKKNSYLILEIGENQYLDCLKIFVNSGLKLIKKTKDLQKKDRILVFSKI